MAATGDDDITKQTGSTDNPTPVKQVSARTASARLLKQLKEGCQTSVDRRGTTLHVLQQDQAYALSRSDFYKLIEFLFEMKARRGGYTFDEDYDVVHHNIGKPPASLVSLKLINLLIEKSNGCHPGNNNNRLFILSLEAIARRTKSIKTIPKSWMEVLMPLMFDDSIDDKIRYPSNLAINRSITLSIIEKAFKDGFDVFNFCEEHKLHFPLVYLNETWLTPELIRHCIKDVDWKEHYQRVDMVGNSNAGITNPHGVINAMMVYGSRVGYDHPELKPLLIDVLKATNTLRQIGRRQDHQYFNNYGSADHETLCEFYGSVFRAERGSFTTKRQQRAYEFYRDDLMFHRVEGDEFVFRTKMFPCATSEDTLNGINLEKFIIPEEDIKTMLSSIDQAYKQRGALVYDGEIRWMSPDSDYDLWYQNLWESSFGTTINQIIGLFDVEERPFMVEMLIASFQRLYRDHIHANLPSPNLYITTTLAEKCLKDKIRDKLQNIEKLCRTYNLELNDYAIFMRELVDEELSVDVTNGLDIEEVFVEEDDMICSG